MQNNPNENYHNLKTEIFEILVPNNHKVAVYVFKPTLNLETPNGNMYFIHGVGGCANVWKHQIQFFASKLWTIISIDLLGHGKSSKVKQNKEYVFQQLTIDALFIFDKFISDTANVMIGHSYGCSIASYIAHERKSFISRLVLISGGSPTPLGSPPCLFYMCNCFLKCVHQIVIKEFRRRAFNKNESALVTNEDKLLAVNIDSKTLKWMMFGQFWNEGDEEFHSRISVPTLLIHGVNDQFVTCEEEYEMLSVLPAATCRVVDNAGHMVMLEQPELVNRFIEEHICQNWDFIETLPTNSNYSNDNTKSPTRTPKSNKKSLPTDKISYFINIKDSKSDVKRNQVQPLSLVL